MSKNLNQFIRADQSAQYHYDIGIAANDANQLIKNLRATFECIREAGLKQTMQKCRFGSTEVAFLGTIITQKASNPPKKNHQLLGENQFSNFQEDFAAISWFPQLLQELHTKLIRETGTKLPTPQKGREGLTDHGTGTTIQRNNQVLDRCSWP